MVALDWNWFFSSVAQSAAAMVGVIAAFLIAKVLSNQAAFHLKRDELPKLLAECGHQQRSQGERTPAFAAKTASNMTSSRATVTSTRVKPACLRARWGRGD